MNSKKVLLTTAGILMFLAITLWITREKTVETPKTETENVTPKTPTVKVVESEQLKVINTAMNFDNHPFGQQWNVEFKKDGVYVLYGYRIIKLEGNPVNDLNKAYQGESFTVGKKNIWIDENILAGRFTSEHFSIIVTVYFNNGKPYYKISDTAYSINYGD